MLRQTNFSHYTHPDLIVGLQTSDDAAVVRMSPDRAIIQTVDFFTPIVDDPWTYGAIAAANSMSDIYAMGGDVLVALNVAAFPEDLPHDMIAEILTGGADKVAEAGGIVAGGHTVIDPEPKYGLSVTGTVQPDRIWTKAGAIVGDVVFLTKPLGTALITTALKRGAADSSVVAAAVQSMLTLNRAASEAARDFAVHAATDITGFGLLGHAAEVADKSRVRIVLESSAVPALPGAIDAASAGHLCGGLGRNQQYFEQETGGDGASGSVSLQAGIPDSLQSLLWDPQTSGGLLLIVPAAEADALVADFQLNDIPLWRIGRVADGHGVQVMV